MYGLSPVIVAVSVVTHYRSDSGYIWSNQLFRICLTGRGVAVHSVCSDDAIHCCGTSQDAYRVVGEPPGPVNVLKQMSNVFTTVALMWLHPAAPNGVITMYQVLLGSEVITNFSSTQVVVSGLIINYNISAVALTCKGKGTTNLP